MLAFASSLKIIFSLPSHFFHLAHLARQAKKQTAICVNRIDTALEQGEFSLLTVAEQKRIQFYVFQSAITQYWFSALHDRKLTSRELQLGPWVGAYTAASDDLIDAKLDTLARQRMQCVVDLANAERKPLQTIAFEDQLKIILNLQEQSRKQKEGPADFKSIENITSLKGGHATLLYRKMYDHPLSEGEEAYILQLGKTLQLVNDVFDVYTDFKEGIRTLPNSFLDPTSFEPYFLSEVALTKKLLFELTIPEKQLRKLWAGNLIIFSRGAVCIGQHKRLQASAGHFQLDTFTRKQLICDMEKPMNLLRWMWLSCALAVKFSA